MKKVLVTGGSGFVAGHVMPAFVRAGWSVRSLVRSAGERAMEGVETVAAGDFHGADWSEHLKGVDVVLHLAARAHRLDEAGREDAAAYRRDNTEVTAALARASARAGVKRFIFLSSVKAMGESTPLHSLWVESSECRPADPYGESKLMAERELERIFAQDGLSVTILRVPLIYGRGVKANFKRLISLVARGIPLPLASVRNARSLLYAGNLADAMLHAAERPEANGTFLLSDGEDLSTPELIRRIARALGAPARLWPVPPGALVWGAGLAGRGEEARRLLESLRVDSTKFRKALDWTPPYGVDDGLKATVAAEGAP